MTSSKAQSEKLKAQMKALAAERPGEHRRAVAMSICLPRFEFFAFRFSL
jgi:hypothetical protein